MSPENARLINSVIALCLLFYAFLVFSGKIPTKRKIDLIEKNGVLLSALALLCMIYPIYKIVIILF